jgi:hypothetical protein
MQRSPTDVPGPRTRFPEAHHPLTRIRFGPSARQQARTVFSPDYERTAGGISVYRRPLGGE